MNVMWLMFTLGLTLHSICVERISGQKITRWATVPSLPRRASEHALRGVVEGGAPGRELVIEAVQQCPNPRSLDPAHFIVSETLSDPDHVLVLDDTWTSGGHAQSVAVAIRAAGAGVVTIMTAARWLEPGFGGTTRFIKDRLTADYDVGCCPWTGGGCP